ncbi:MAG: RidA family protein [Acidobacteriia bacterium]|nr:RidA family protein [Terriglobia bacterium]
MRKLLCALLWTTLLTALPLPAEKKVIAPPEFAPAAGAAAPMFSPGILLDGTLYISGQIGRDLKTREVPADFEAEVKKCLEDIGVVLKAAGMTYEHVVAVQVYLTDMELFARMNAVYSTVFKEPRPTRTTVGVTKLADPKARIEITVTARK